MTRFIWRVIKATGIWFWYFGYRSISEAWDEAES